jgi:chromosome segregation ATPase
MNPAKSIALSMLFLLVAGSFCPILAVSEQRQAYDKMVEEATKEADEYLQEKQEEMKASEAAAQTQEDAALQKRVQAESQRINAEMDKVRGRGIGYGFSQGMKDNLLQQYQDQLDRLNSDPEAYFEGQ